MSYDEIRFCDNCMRKTKHIIISNIDITTYKRKRLYKCLICNKESWKRGLRPSAEAVY